MRQTNSIQKVHGFELDADVHVTPMLTRALKALKAKHALYIQMDDSPEQQAVGDVLTKLAGEIGFQVFHTGDSHQLLIIEEIQFEIDLDTKPSIAKARVKGSWPPVKTPVPPMPEPPRPPNRKRT